MTAYNLYTDGGARGNPGPAGAGAVLFDHEGLFVASSGQYLGECTNNEAEYMALIMGIELAIEKGVADLVCYLDSELVVKQLNGQYKVKNARLSRHYSVVKTLENQLSTISYVHVTRDKNAEADRLVNEAIDNATK